jgi:hypothetical protein
MKIQALPFILLALTLGVTPAAQAAGDCALMRMYKDEKKIMQHFSTQTLREGGANASLCSSSCRRQAETIPMIDANQLKDKKNVTTALLRCTYSDNYGSHATNSKTIAESTVPIGQLRLEERSSSRTEQRRNEGMNLPDVVQSEIPHPTPPSTPQVQSVIPQGTTNEPPSTSSRGSEGNNSGSRYGIVRGGASSEGGSASDSTSNMNGRGGYRSPYDTPYRSPYDHPSLSRQLQTIGEGSEKNDQGRGTSADRFHRY